ncbi:MAG: hypothetical protein GQ574_22515 [Crocinitomix sp.]|nr:hypothetical protein [Crocinitomix sp.]
MKKTILILTLIFFGQFSALSQGDNFMINDIDLEQSFRKRKLSRPHNQPVTYQYKYIYSPYGKTFGARGLMANFGLNFAKLDNDKIIFGPIMDFKLNPGRHRILAPNEFLSDFNDSYSPVNTTPQDSAYSQVIHQNLNGGILGNSILNFGIMFSAFPNRYGGILFEIKTGITYLQAHSNIYGNTFVNGGGNDRVAFTTTKNLICEMTFKPYAIFKNSYIEGNYFDFIEFLKTIAISFYYERFNFKNTEFKGMEVRELVPDEFMTKYGVDNRFGFKIGLAFY